MSTALTSRKPSRRWYALVVGLLAAIGLCASTIPASASVSDVIAIQNDHSGLCMSVPGDNIYAGAVINQWYCGLYQDQYWVEEYSDSHDNWFYLQPRQNTSLCATYVPGSYAQLTLQYCGPHAANGNVNTQLWESWWTGEEETAQGWAMSVPGARTDAGAPINIYPWGNYPDQGWYTPIQG
jgi:hypothetical protein